MAGDDTGADLADPLCWSGHHDDLDISDLLFRHRRSFNNAAFPQWQMEADQADQPRPGSGYCRTGGGRGSGLSFFSARGIGGRAVSGAVALGADGVGECFWAEEVADIVEGDLCDVGHRLSGKEGLMGGYKDVGEGHESGEFIVVDGVIGEVFKEVVALLLIYVEGGGADVFGLQSLDEGFGIDEFSAAGIDDEHAFFHHFYCVVIDHVDVVGGEGAVKGDNVGLAVDLFERQIFKIILFGGLEIGEEVVGDDFNAEPLEDFSENEADFPGSYNAESFTPEVESEESIDGEVVFSDAVVCAVERPVEGHNHSEGIFGHGVRGVSWHADDGNFAVSGFQADVVVSGAAHGDKFNAHIVERVNGFVVDIVVDESAHRVESFCHSDGLWSESGFKIFELEAIVFIAFVKEAAVVRFGVKESDADIFHINFLLNYIYYILQ